MLSTFQLRLSVQVGEECTRITEFLKPGSDKSSEKVCVSSTSSISLSQPSTSMITTSSSTQEIKDKEIPETSRQYVSLVNSHTAPAAYVKICKVCLV
jgi:hypothetical protein